MALRHPQEIQEQQVVLSRGQPGPAPHHLAVQAAHLRRPQHHDAVHGRAVPAFRQQHAVAQHVVFPGVKICQHFCPVRTFPVNLCRPEPTAVQDVPELLTGLYQRQEYHRLPVHAVFHHLICDLVQIRIQSGADLACLEIPGLHGYPGQVHL